MNCPKYKQCFLLLLCMLMQVGYTQEMRFETLTQENVFDKQPVLAIAQDAQGRLWFGGENNLYVYNSKTISNLSTTDVAFRRMGYITKICINSQNHLFIATATELRIYDINKRKPILENGLPYVKKLVVLDIRAINGHVFLCTSTGLYTLTTDKDTYRLTRLLERKQTQTITAVGKERYALASASGIEMFTFTNNKVSDIIDTFFPIQGASNRIIPSLHFEKDSLWVGSKFQGIFLYTLKDGLWKGFHEHNSNILSNNVRKITRDPKGNLLIGTLKGLSIWRGKGMFQNYKHNAHEQNSLSQNSIYDIFIDDQSIVWLGTYFGGINAIYPKLARMNVFSTRAPIPERLTSDIVGSFTESKDLYWIGTEEEGINTIDKKTGKTTTFPHFTRSNLVKDLFVRNNKLYAAQYAGGYSIIDINQLTHTHHFLNPDPFHVQNNVFSIYVDTAETIYLGTNVGLYRVEKNRGRQQIHELGQNTITDIQEGKNKDIYVLANAQLYRKIQQDKPFKLDTLTGHDINGMHIDEGGNLWFTTQESIYKRSKNGTLLHIATFKGNNLGWPVRNKETLWITSKNGLIFHDLTTHYTNVLTEQDGLPVKNLQHAKIFLSNDHCLWIATLNGLVSINPKQVVFNRQPPSVIFQNIWINDTLLPFDRLQPSLLHNSYKLMLAHNENFLNISFASSNFINPTKNRYRYKLEDFDKDWIEIGNPYIRYTNIPEGTHKLLIYASNNDMVWSKTPLEIEITVHPPVWRTWWAYMLYALLFTLMAHLIIKFIVEREVLLNSEKEKEKKIKFFTQISHEIRTPLTLITAPLDEIIAETADQTATQLKITRIKKNANKLLSIVNELLDFKKFDDKQHLLKRTDTPLREYLEDNFYLLYDLARTKGINYYLRKIDRVGLVQIDPTQFDKVMFNLLSNAIKYSKQAGTVYLDLLDKGDQVEIRVVDNGIGIVPGNQFKIFEEYYRENRDDNVIGTGIGLALAKRIVEQHAGIISCNTFTEDMTAWTCFTVTLPKINQSAPVIEEDVSGMPTSSALHTPQVLEGNTEIILIAEDNQELRDILVNIFKDNFEVLIAPNGEEALELAKRHIPDIIISDIMMPKMSGTALCKAIKSDQTTSHIPFILLTAVTDLSVQTEAMQYGANIYLLKPFERNQLYLSVINLLQISQKHRKEFQLTAVVTDNKIDRLFLQTLDKLIEHNLSNDGFDVNFISREMGMSAPILYRKLRAITDLSLNNYVKQYRLTKATTLLQTTMNISEVAYSVGFSDRKYFSKEFKKHFGITPTEYLNPTNPSN